MHVTISRETACALIDVIQGCGKGLVRLLPALESELSPDEFKRIKREIGRVISVMDESLSAKVAAEYPDLVPEAVPIARKL
jgi:hypothetical protein